MDRSDAGWTYSGNNVRRIGYAGMGPIEDVGVVFVIEHA